MQPQFSSQSQGVVARAKQLAGEQGSGVAGEAHLLLSVLEVSDEADDLLSPLLARSGISREEARLYAQSAVVIIPPIAGKTPQLSRGARKILFNAAIRARFSFDFTPRIEPHHIFIACVDLRRRRGSTMGKVLRSLGFNAPQLHRDLHELRAQKLKNPLNNLSPRAKIALEAAHDAMRASFCGRISAAHLLLGLLSDKENIATEMLEKASCDLEDLQKRARDSIKSDGEIAMHQKRFSPGAKRALERASRAAKESGHKFIDCGDLLLGLLPARETWGEKWRARGRELDGVEGLLMAEGVAAPPLQKTRPKPKRAAPVIWWIYLFSFTIGLIWGAALNERVSDPSLALTVNTIALGVPLVTGIGNCAGHFFDVPLRFRRVCRSIFAGWLIGIILGAILLVHF